MWYSACLFFRSVHNHHPTEKDLWELQIVLIQSENEEDAKVLAQAIGEENEVEYVSATGDNVHWRFQHVDRVSEVDDIELRTGTEVFSRLMFEDEVRDFSKPFNSNCSQGDGDK